MIVVRIIPVSSIYEVDSRSGLVSDEIGKCVRGAVSALSARLFAPSDSGKSPLAPRLNSDPWTR